jgi:hypothetical protein
VPPDHDRSGPDLPQATGSECYGERLTVPLRWWALTTMFLASLLLAFLVAMPAGIAFLLAGVVTAIIVSVLAAYGSAYVVIQDGTFRAGRAAIPVRFLSAPQPLDASQTRRTAGVEADARAYLLLRPYVPRAVRVRVMDPADPTPYWLVSTRHPETLTAALTGAIGEARSAERP